MNPADTGDRASAAWGRGKRSFVWVNVAVQAVIVLSIVVVGILVARKFNRRFDLTSRGAFRVSNVAEDLLRRVDYTLQAWITSAEYSRGASDDRALQNAWARTLDLLHEFKLRSARLEVTPVHRGNTEELIRIQKHWPSPVSAHVYLLATFADGKTTKKAISVHQLYEGNPQTGELRSYTGEPVLVQAIRDIKSATKTVVYETAGHQEIPTSDVRALGSLAATFVSNEGVEFKRLETAAARGIPVDCDILMILGPQQPFTEQETKLVREYIDRGGNLFVSLRPRTPTGLEKLLEENGIEVGKEVVHDPASYVTGHFSNLLVRDFMAHEVNSLVGGATLYIPDCACLHLREMGSGWRTVPLARSGTSSWGETTPCSGATTARCRPDPEDHTGGNLSLVVAVERPSVATAKKGARLLVWGSTQALTNSVLMGRELQLQYLVNSFRWLVHRPSIKIEVHNVPWKPLDMTPQQVTKLRWVVIVGFPMLGVILGVIAWYFRRK